MEHAPDVDRPLDDASGAEVEPDRPDHDVSGLAEQVAPSGHLTGHLTGHPAVDEVLGSLERLEEMPVDEHAEAYERAHDQLRGALADARDTED